MPPKDWKARKLEPSVAESTEWKRLFFGKVSYESVDELVSAAAAGGMAETYVTSFLQLPHHRKRRRTVSDLVSAMRSDSKPHWVTKVQSGLWLLYSTERTMWKWEDQEEDAAMTTATRQQRAVFQGSGLTKVRRQSLTKRAGEMRADAVAAASGGSCVLWMDNYNKFRYSRNPNEARHVHQCHGVLATAAARFGPLGLATVAFSKAAVRGCYSSWSSYASSSPAVQ